ALRHDEEAAIDRGSESNIVSIHCEREDLEGESLHVPLKTTKNPTGVSSWGSCTDLTVVSASTIPQ
uniref:Uncharacterized protein n=1 Tax=Strix occidentalis caurina TaxID=311401 RepID=A0A8D0EXF6_STROC